MWSLWPKYLSLTSIQLLSDTLSAFALPSLPCTSSTMLNLPSCFWSHPVRFLSCSYQLFEGSWKITKTMSPTPNPKKGRKKMSQIRINDLERTVFGFQIEKLFFFFHLEASISYPKSYSLFCFKKIPPFWEKLWYFAGNLIFFYVLLGFGEEVRIR